MEIRTLTVEDLEQAWEVSSDAFHVDSDQHDGYLRNTDPTRLIGAFDGSRLAALSGARAYGQYFGGRSVPMGGLSSVAVRPEYRGRGLARRTTEAVLEAMGQRGEAISSLFPATTRLYRQMGWEVAGHIVYRTIAPAALQALPKPDDVRVRAGEDGDDDAIRACYARVAPEINGFLERPARAWSALRAFWKSRSVFVVEGAGGGVEGYLVYRQLDGEYSGLGGPFQIVVDEFLAASRDATLALWRLLGSWASQVERAFYRAPAEDPLLLLLPEQEQRVLAEVRWMTRVVDPPGAIEARGFPRGLDGRAELELRDSGVGESHRFVLTLDGGRGRLEAGGEGTVRVDRGAFASLYSGWATTAMLRRAGRLECDSAESLAFLDAAFAGPTPWMLDEF